MRKMPTLMLVHGGWSGAWVWDYLGSELETLDAPSIAIELPGCGPDRPFGWGISFKDYVDTIVTSANRIDGPLVLVCHSAGGFAASQAAALIPQRLCSLVYIAAYLPVDGESLASLSTKDEGSTIKSTIKPNFFRGTLIQPPAAIETSSYHDCSLAEISTLVAKHRPEPIRPGMAKVRLDSAFNDIPKHYICCTQDRGLSPAFQQWMTSRYKIDSIHDLNTGHMPMISSPSKLATVLAEIAANSNKP